MWRLVRAFAWLRWRLLMNALERTGRRDLVQRFALATEQLGPILMGLLLVPGALALAGLGLLAGHTVAREGSFLPPLALAARFILLALFVSAALGPLLFPLARQPRNLVRLLLLPIPRQFLFLLESASCLADPWVAVLMPMLLTIPIGLAWGGRPAAAALALVSGAALFVAVVGLALLGTSLFQLVMRDRRRGELLAVILVFIPLMFSLFHMVGTDDRRRARERRDPPVVAETRTESWAARRPASGALKYVPTELYLATFLEPTAQPARALGALAGLLIVGAGVQGASWAVYQRLLAGPAGSHAHAARGAALSWGRLPGLSRQASAVALAQMRLMTRTPRGRIAFIMPIVVTGVFAVPTLIGRSPSPFHISTLPPGVVLGLIGAAFSMLAVGPIALNQFAADGAGLTLQILAPIGDRDLIVGKAAGLGAAALAPVLVCQVLLFALFPGTPPDLALAPPLAALAACFLITPVWAVLSAVFPRVVDLSTIGRSGNPHGAANLLGTLALVASLAPSVGLGLLTMWWLGRPHLTAPLVAAWCGLAYFIGRVLLLPAIATWRARRENLALVAQGR